MHNRMFRVNREGAIVLYPSCENATGFGPAVTVAAVTTYGRGEHSLAFPA